MEKLLPFPIHSKVHFLFCFVLFCLFSYFMSFVRGCHIIKQSAYCPSTTNKVIMFKDIDFLRQFIISFLEITIYIYIYVFAYL